MHKGEILPALRSTYYHYAFLIPTGRTRAKTTRAKTTRAKTTRAETTKGWAIWASELAILGRALKRRVSESFCVWNFLQMAEKPTLEHGLGATPFGLL